jgi:acetyl-CoA carboxylase biotin carboxyl carrier protein
MAEGHGMPMAGELAELSDHTLRMAVELPGALRRISVRSRDTTIEIEWQLPREPVAVDVAGPAERAALVPASTEAAELDGDGGFLVRSPMVGTVYRAPRRGAPPFVEVGDVVAEGQTLALVEAMKLFNPIVVESVGVVVEVLVEDGQPVEFDQPIVLLAAVPAAGDRGE